MREGCGEGLACLAGAVIKHGRDGRLGVHRCCQDHGKVERKMLGMPRDLAEAGANLRGRPRVMRNLVGFMFESISCREEKMTGMGLFGCGVVVAAGVRWRTVAMARVTIDLRVLHPKGTRLDLTVLG